MRKSLWPDSSAAEVGPLLAGHLPRSYSVLVADRPDGGIVGFVEVAVRDYADGCSEGPVAYLEGIWVAPDQRRAGVGRALLRAALAWGAARGLGELASDTSPDNLASRAFHEAEGFQEVGQAVLYRRPIPGP
jgi:aminoglycoside 6'-N-acetyltransferase I